MIPLNLLNFETLPDAPEVLECKGKQKIRYLNTANSFDIETSSFYDENNTKRACMYLFMFCIDGITFYGRTWAQFSFALEMLQHRYKLDYYNRMIIYVHNLAYEFQFMYHRCNITDVFARTKRHPIKCLVNNCFEFRCSYFLSGLSLAKTAEEIPDLSIRKLIGDLDYSLIRHSKTKLSQDELNYGEYDVLIVHYFIKNEIKKCGTIKDIPLTKTGYVRLYCRKYIREHTNYRTYRSRLLKAAPIDKDLFILLNKAFAGGYTHANCNHILSKREHVYSIDFQSCYPAQMLAHKFPMSPFIHRKLITKDTFLKYVKEYACVFEIRLGNIKSKTPHHIWSVSKCSYGTTSMFKALNDNGRIVQSEEIYTYMTDVDYKNFEKFYTFDILEVHNLWTSTYGYLPKELIECVLKFYGDKTQLKGVRGKEEQYLIAKGMLNALYGMCVTNPVNDDIIFDDMTEDEKLIWSKIRPDISEALERAYNNDKQFLNYQWGVWITAWSRYELFTGLLEMGDDAVYSDTDSIKFMNMCEHQFYIKKYNKEVVKRINETLKYYDIDPEKARPTDKKGNKRQLGIWEYEGNYKTFKTLGAKRYAYITKDDKLHITVSGLSKLMIYSDEVDDAAEFKAIDDDPRFNTPEEIHNEKMRLRNVLYSACPVQYIIDNGGIDFFDEGMLIPAEYSKRLTHTYSNEHYKCQLTDYNGVTDTVEEFGYIHLEKSTFSMSFAEEFYQFLVGIDNGIIMKKRAVREELAINNFFRDYEEIEVL